MIDPRLDKDIDDAEECKLVAYLDSLGFWTIGWGHLIPAGVDPHGLVWTQEQADAQRDKDVGMAQRYAQQTPEWLYLDTDCRRNAVVELCFNMSHKWMLFVNCRAAIRAHRWQEAHDALLNSLWASQVHAKRADRLADYLLTGQYPTQGA